MNLAHSALADIEHVIVLYGAFAVFLVIYGESLGLPLPGESGLIAASLLAVRGDLDIQHVFVAAFLGAVAGDSTGFMIGRFGGRRLLLRYGGKIGLTPERLDRVEAQARQKGFMMVLTARFIVVLRQLNGLVAGSVGMKWVHFAAANMLGALLWAGLWTFGPYYFTDAFKRFF